MCRQRTDYGIPLALIGRCTELACMPNANHNPPAKQPARLVLRAPLPNVPTSASQLLDDDDDTAPSACYKTPTRQADGSPNDPAQSFHSQHAYVCVCVYECPLSSHTVRSSTECNPLDTQFTLSVICFYTFVQRAGNKHIAQCANMGSTAAWHGTNADLSDV